jgi:division protein CdvB (Snf7/Vps24/ESCRT-III family)
MIRGSSVVDKEKLKQYCVTGTKHSEKLFYYADLTKELYRLPDEYNIIEEDQDELVNLIENKVGSPSNKDTSHKSSKIEDEKIKDKLSDLGYM